MPRFFLSGGSSIAGGTAFILGEDAAHAKVLRLRVGDTMIVCDGRQGPPLHRYEDHAQRGRG